MRQSHKSQDRLRKWDVGVESCKAACWYGFGQPCMHDIRMHLQPIAHRRAEKSVIGRLILAKTSYFLLRRAESAAHILKCAAYFAFVGANIINAARKCSALLNKTGSLGTVSTLFALRVLPSFVPSGGGIGGIVLDMIGS
ncbi:hypothetical protein Tco_0792766 [Tanacetum coccineum]